MAEKIKILVSGDAKGRFKQLFQRVEGINRKAGPFEILLCIGDFFDEGNDNDQLECYKNGTDKIPVSTYILGPNSEAQVRFYTNMNDGEICTNLTYIGKRGLYTLSSGVKIAYLSGIENDASKESFNFDEGDVMAVCNMCFVSKNSLNDYKGVDVLITSQWPWGVDKVNNSSKLISFLCKEIKPRYHFCALNGVHHEPPPYRMFSDHITQLELCTRFVSLAAVGNIEKQKYIYALSITPVEKMRVIELIQKTINETPSPFEKLDRNVCRQANTKDQGCKQYFFDMNSNDKESRKRRDDRTGGFNERKKRFRLEIDQEKCWFCLSSPDVEKHLVISIGEHFYLALAKGPISEFHVLILSIMHIPSASLLSSDIWKELIKFKESIKSFLKKEGYVATFTERFYKCSHLQINAFGIDEGYAWKIKHAFQDKGEEYNLKFEELPKLTDPSMLPQQGPYFVAELPDDTTLLTRDMKHFPLHFARDVFCSENLLNCEEKVDWKDCKLDKNEEIELVKNFRSKFAKYDFTL